MIKSFIAALSLLVLVSCQTTETAVVEQEQEKEKKKYLAGQVVAITEMCKTLENQLQIFKTFMVDKRLGMQIYYNLLYSGKCLSFPKPILAKKLKKEFEADVDKVSKIEIWKVVLDENMPEGKDLVFFWISVHVPLEKNPIGTGV